LAGVLLVFCGGSESKAEAEYRDFAGDWFEATDNRLEQVRFGGENTTGDNARF